MHILHICSEFLGTTAHISLFTELDKLGVVQTIFVPINASANSNRRTMSFQTEGSSIVLSRRQHKIHKYLYGLKIARLTKDAECSINMNDIDLIHASVMCNEGAIAYELSKKYNIPYITAVRNTDINSYMKIFRWRMGYFKKIANNAMKIIFISSQYPQRLKEAMNISENETITSKFEIIHNGLQSFYLDNINKEKHGIHNPVRVVVTGAFVKNKNIHTLFDSIRILRNEGMNIELAAIGNNLATYNSEKEYADSINRLALSNNWFHTYKAQPKEELYQTLRNYDIFALVSFQETFGLSYLEALSQGLPIIFTKGEGFDNTYPEGLVGYSAIATDRRNIANAIKKMVDNYHDMVVNVSHLDLNIYKWSSIARRYKDLYFEISGIK